MSRRARQFSHGVHTGVKLFTPNVTPCDAFHTGVHTSAHAGVHTGVELFTPVRTPCDAFSHQRAHQREQRRGQIVQVHSVGQFISF